MPKKVKTPIRAMSKQDELLEEQTKYLVNFHKKKLTTAETCKLFIYNPETKAFMGRTPSSWSKIGLFYLVFYGMLAALVSICMWVFFQTLNPRIPKWQLDQSVIGTNPGLGFRPMSINNSESSLIWFEGSNKKNYQPWVDNLLQFLDGYYFPSKIAKGSGQIKTCSHSDFPTGDEVCEVDVREWGQCNKDEFFDYHRSSPCIFLKLNRIYGWTPDYYIYDHELPPEMPKQLKDHIKSINNTRDRKNVWVSCEGETPADREYIGRTTYFPKTFQGFPGYYFPYLNREGYLSPLVAVRFERPVPKIGLFYLVFYDMLASIGLHLHVGVLSNSINPEIPKWQLDQSVIGTNPGLEFRPMSINNSESSLIWLEGSNKKDYQPWVDNLLKFLDGYYFPSKIAKGSGQIKTCSHSDFPTGDEVCEVDVREWGKCNKDEFFCYHRSSPCIFLKLNRIYGWTPDYYIYDHELPPEMPKQLKDHIKSINNTRDRKNVWVSCEGENPADKEYIGSRTYYPKTFQGFPGYYFPYLNREGYLSPLVAVYFERPFPGIIINVECRAWAKNIHYSRADRTGFVHFELLID